MKKFLRVFFVAAMAVSITAIAAPSTSLVDRPGGIKVGSRLTLRPYVSFNYTYDSNVDSSKHSSRAGNSSFVVSPNLGIDYANDNWKIAGRLFYQYHAYTESTDQLNTQSYGEQVAVTWNSLGLDHKGGQGWQLMLSQSYRQISQDDDMTESDGRGIGRDRQQFDFNGALGHRFTERFHANITAGYYWLDYDNDYYAYAPLYGWSRATGGVSLGYTASKWFDILLVGEYHCYEQDNNKYIRKEWEPAASDGHHDGDSDGWSVQAGIGSYLTERISYRALAGWSRFNYSNNGSDDGFVYTLSCQWKVSETLNMMLMGTSYYQPSERNYNTALKNYTASFGLGKSLVRGKLNATLDLSYRYEEAVEADYAAADYDENIVTARIGLNYTLNRFLSVFGRVEYQTEFTSGGASEISNNYDYDRWRATLGFTLTY